MHSVSLSFRLRLSFECERGMAIRLHTSCLNYHLAIHTQKYLNICYFAMSGQIKKGTHISEHPNGNLAVHKSVGRSHPNSNANGIWGIQNQWRIQDFSQVGAPTLQHTILPKFPKNCMKLKEFGPPGGVPRAPLRSATENTHSFLFLANIYTHICSGTAHVK